MITKTQWVLTGYSGKFSGCLSWKFSGCLIMEIQWVRAAPFVLRCIRSNVINNYYSGSSGWVEISYVRIATAFVLALWPIINRGESDAQIHLLLGPSFLCYFICYYASVSYFLFWSNWIDFSYFILIKFMSESKRIFDEKSKCFGVRCKMFSTMFSTRQCFSLTFMKAIFTCAWAGNACLLLSIFLP